MLLCLWIKIGFYLLLEMYSLSVNDPPLPYKSPYRDLADDTTFAGLRGLPGCCLVQVLLKYASQLYRTPRLSCSSGLQRASPEGAPQDSAIAQSH